jgi:hypothetical protein
MKRTAYALRRASKLIEQEDPRCFDLAATHGQQFENVKHMTWFIDAVASTISEPLLTDPQLKLLRTLSESPRRGEYVSPSYPPIKRLAELKFVESFIRPMSCGRLEDFWRATPAGKEYVKEHG